MRRLSFGVFMLVFGGLVFAQAARGSFVGVVTGPGGAPVADAPSRHAASRAGLSFALSPGRTAITRWRRCQLECTTSRS